MKRFFFFMCLAVSLLSCSNKIALPPHPNTLVVNDEYVVCTTPTEFVGKTTLYISSIPVRVYLYDTYDGGVVYSYEPMTLGCSAAARWRDDFFGIRSGSSILFAVQDMVETNEELTEHLKK